jgi:3-(3-hydroxy-phenyl)propionate hydroxylase
MKTYPSEIPVVIIGAGPTGLTIGLLLAEYGVKSVILDRNNAPMDIPRAIVLDDEGARTLQCFGADQTYVRKTIERKVLNTSTTAE